MAKLKIDFEQLAETKTDYKTSMEELSEIRQRIHNAMNELQNSKWDSLASTAFFNMYEEKWDYNMKLHEKVLSTLHRHLCDVELSFKQIYEDIPNLNNSLTK